MKLRLVECERKIMKILKLLVIGLMFSIGSMPMLNAKVHSVVDYTNIEWGKPDYVSGHGWNDAGSKKVTTGSCWGGSCGTHRSASNGNSAYSSYSVYYGSTMGSANQHSWQP